MGFLSNLGNDFVGNVEHAMIGFMPIDTASSGQDDEKEQKKAQKLEAKRLKALSALGEKSKSDGMTADDVKGLHTGMVFLPVTYNPDTLRIVASRGRQRTNDNKYEVLNLDVPAAAELSADLIFDRMTVGDAFMTENLNLSATNLVKSAARYLNPSNTSVQSCVEGMAAAILKKETRGVVFVWGNTCFAGNLISLSAQYTMFNMQGDPVRATAKITIRDQLDKENSRGKGYWVRANKDFSKLAGSIDGDGNTKTNINSWTKNWGNLLNL